MRETRTSGSTSGKWNRNNAAPLLGSTCIGHGLLFSASLGFLRVNRSVKTDHHFFPSLVAPADGFRGVGARRVVWGVVEVRDAFDRRSLRDSKRFSEAVAMLPIEVVIGNVEQDLGRAVWVVGREAKIFSAQVHVRHQRQEFDVFREPRARHDAMIAVPRRNVESKVDGTAASDRT